MPRNRRDQDRDSKRDEIVAAARALFVADGFDATAMSRLAATAGVAPNTIYWYFKDKDDLLAAVLDGEFASGMDEYLQQRFANLGERVLWVAQRLQQVSGLINTVHARVAFSDTVRVLHDRFHAITEALLRAELLNQGMRAERADAWVKICVFTVEGLLSHDLSAQQQRDICMALVPA